MTQDETRETLKEVRNRLAKEQEHLYVFVEEYVKKDWIDFGTDGMAELMGKLNMQSKIIDILRSDYNEKAWEEIERMHQKNHEDAKMLQEKQLELQKENKQINRSIQRTNIAIAIFTALYAIAFIVTFVYAMYYPPSQNQQITPSQTTSSRPQDKQTPKPPIKKSP